MVISLSGLEELYKLDELLNNKAKKVRLSEEFERKLRSVDSAKAKYDLYAKLILADTHLAACILKELAHEFMDMLINEIQQCVSYHAWVDEMPLPVGLMNLSDNVDLSSQEVSTDNEHTNRFDVLFKASDVPSKGRVYINFES